MIKAKNHGSIEVEKLAFDAGELVMAAIEDDFITEIMLNPDRSLWVEHRTRGDVQGRGSFRSASQLLLFIQQQD